jgi:aspartyl/asparaginyl beta-hydroxylase (cupin superfamily)
MIFDDTYEHEAWNDTDKTRVVLFVDFVRPLRNPGALAAQLVRAVGDRVLPIYRRRQAPPARLGEAL